MLILSEPDFYQVPTPPEPDVGTIGHQLIPELRGLGILESGGIVLNPGAGDGGDASVLLGSYPSARIHCSEPNSALLAKLADRLRKTAPPPVDITFGGAGSTAEISIDVFCAANLIPFIEMIWFGVGQSAWPALRGAELMLKSKRVRSVSFICPGDAGQAWLREAFQLLKEYGFRNHRALQGMLHYLPRWDEQIAKWRDTRFFAYLEDFNPVFLKRTGTRS